MGGEDSEALYGFAVSLIYYMRSASVRLTTIRDPGHSRLTLHPAEIFPFIISVVVVVQGAVFIGIQSAMLEKVTSGDCRTTAQVVWPGIDSSTTCTYNSFLILNSALDCSIHNACLRHRDNF